MYRIVQECLTNSLRHAGPVPVTVRVQRASDSIVVRVDDTGPRPDVPLAPLRGTGQGLVGMAERVAIFGGTLVHGPRSTVPGPAEDGRCTPPYPWVDPQPADLHPAVEPPRPRVDHRDRTLGRSAGPLIDARLSPITRKPPRGRRGDEEGIMSVIHVNGLVKRYGRRDVVGDLSFEVPAGSVTAFLGLNGAGKTSTLRVLLGLAAPTRGSATVFGRP